MAKEIFFVFVGGGVGSVCRYFLSRYLNPLLPALPFGTLAANVTACMVFGALAGWAYTQTNFSAYVRLLVLSGFCGGLSTFSTFNFEIFQMMKDGQYINAAFYAFLSLFLCLVSFVSANFIFSK